MTKQILGVVVVFLSLLLFVLTGILGFHGIVEKSQVDQKNWKNSYETLAVLAASHCRLELEKLSQQIQGILDNQQETLKRNESHLKAIPSSLDSFFPKKEDKNPGYQKIDFNSNPLILDLLVLKKDFFEEYSKNHDLALNYFVAFGWNGNQSLLSPDEVTPAHFSNLISQTELTELSKNIMIPSNVLLSSYSNPVLGKDSTALLFIPKIENGSYVGGILSHINLEFFKQIFLFHRLISENFNLTLKDRIGNVLFKTEKNQNMDHKEVAKLEMEERVNFAGLSLTLDVLTPNIAFSFESFLKDHYQLLMIYFSLVLLILFFLSFSFFRTSSGETFSKKSSMNLLLNKKKFGMKTFLCLVWIEPEKFLKMIDYLDEPEKLVNDWLNQFRHAIQAVIDQNQGQLVSQDNGNWVVVWNDESTDGTALKVDAFKAAQCALDLRRLFSDWNTFPGHETEKKIIYGIGMSSGNGYGFESVDLAQKKSKSKNQVNQVLSEGLSVARTLAGIAFDLGVDCLVTAELVERLGSHFKTIAFDDVVLKAELSTLKIQSLVTHFREEKTPSSEQLWEQFRLACALSASENRVHSPQSRLFVQEKKINPLQPPIPRWLVNNGFQIVGPLTAEEISNALFAQELDFDCACWLELTGDSSSIRNAHIFKGSDDNESAHLWVFDGKMVHGPFSFGFLKTAVQLGAISREGWICKESTVSGWHKIADFLQGHEPQS